MTDAPQHPIPGVSWDRYVDARLSAIEKALEKAEGQLDQRQNVANAFREQLKDQAATFATRENVNLVHAQLEKQIADLATKVGDLEKCQANAAGKSWMAWSLLTLFLTVLSLALKFLV